MINRKVFYNYIRRAPFANRLSQQQIDGLSAILGYWDDRADICRDPRHLAYILATVFHETGSKMHPVREGFAKTDATARKIVSKYKYGKPTSTGHVYYGRGYVQITWDENYRRLGDLIGVDLLHNPDLALQEDIAVKILFEGMFNGASKDGDFTGKALEDYFNDTTEDPVGARRIINGKDKAGLIAGYYKNFLDAIHASDDDVNSIADVAAKAVELPEVKADGANLMVDKTMIGAVTAGAGGIVTSLVAAISNPWALAAFGIIAVGVFLVVTGRIEIKTRAGA